MIPFTALSRAGQRRRLRALAEVALAAYGVTDARLTFCSDTENTVFRIDTAGGRCALRIHGADGRAAPAIHAELAWLTALRRDLGLRVPEPIQTRDGQALCVVQLPGVPEPRPAVLFRWVAGRPLAAGVTAQRLAELGRLTAQLHTHAATFRIPPGTDRDRDDWPGMRHWPLADSPAGRVLTPAQHALCAAAAERAADVIAQIDLGSASGLIHSDIHFTNLLDCGDALGLIDFDDCQFAPFTNDLAITLTYLDDRPDGERLRAALLEGYSEVRSLPADAVAELDAFMVERGLRLIRRVASWPRVDHFPFGQYTIDVALRRCARYLQAIA
jgi:Ser/Thr protein kinase RdoA (MazF antagonist)